MMEIKIQPLKDMTINMSKYATPSVTPWMMARASCWSEVARNVAY